MSAKSNGTAFETFIVNWLRDNGHRWVERRALAGNKDKGDIAGIPGVVLECKRHHKQNLGTWVTEAQAEAVNAGVDIFAVVAKRWGYGKGGDQYVITTLDVFNRLLCDNTTPAATTRTAPTVEGDT